jgi:hypothetical protein
MSRQSCCRRCPISVWSNAASSCARQRHSAFRSPYRSKTDLAPFVGANLELMIEEADQVRRRRPVMLTNCKGGEGVEAVVDRLSAMSSLPVERAFGLEAERPAPDSLARPLVSGRLELEFAADAETRTYLRRQYAFACRADFATSFRRSGLTAVKPRSVSLNCQNRPESWSASSLPMARRSSAPCTRRGARLVLC